MPRVNELRFIARIAHMYYIEGKRQSAIAEHLHLSQATVSRMLKRAHEENIVRISLASPEGTYTEAEAGLRQKYGLTEAIVVDCAEDRQGAIMSRIGEAAAHFLETTIQEGEVIGVSSWSQTILKMIGNIHPMRQGKARSVVQLLGGMGNPSVQKHATQLTTSLAQLTGGEPLILSAPGVAASREAKIVLLGDAYVRETMEQFRNISLAIVGIGAIEPSQMLADSGNIFSEAELSQLTAGGAVSEISLRFFDAEGRDVKTPLDERVIGMTTEELRAVPRVIALAGGQPKTAAIAAALKSGALDVLITDHFTADRLLQGEGELHEAL